MIPRSISREPVEYDEFERVLIKLSLERENKSELEAENAALKAALTKEFDESYKKIDVLMVRAEKAEAQLAEYEKALRVLARICAIPFFRFDVNVSNNSIKKMEKEARRGLIRPEKYDAGIIKLSETLIAYAKQEANRAWDYIAELERR